MLCCQVLQAEGVAGIFDYTSEAYFYHKEFEGFFSICICLISQVPKVPYALSSCPALCTIHSCSQHFFWTPLQSRIARGAGPRLVSPAALGTAQLCCLMGVLCSLPVTHMAFLRRPSTRALARLSALVSAGGPSGKKI